MLRFFGTEHAGGGKGGGRGQDWSEHRKKCGTHAYDLASSTQRGKDGGEEGLVPPMSHGGLG